MFSFFMALVTRLVPEKYEEDELWKLFDSIIPHCKDTSTMYDDILKAINTFHPEEINTNVMLTLLGKSSFKDRTFENTVVFTDYVQIKSIGQLLNSPLSPLQRSEIIFAEIQKGLRSDRVIGLPAHEIIKFFTAEESDFIIKNFDINMLIVNLYISVFNITNLDRYIESQLKYCEFQYGYANKQKEGDAAQEGNNKIAGESIEFLKGNLKAQLSEHYINSKAILDRLLSLFDKTTSTPALNYYTLAYILIHVPPESFFVYSSYLKTLNMFIDYYSSDLDEKVYVSYYNPIRDIIKLNPNINLPYNLMKTLFNGIDLDEIIDGLLLGFARYAFHTIQKFSDRLQSDMYQKLSYIEKINYILDTLDSDYNDLNKECLKNQCGEECDHSYLGEDGKSYNCELVENQVFQLRNSQLYKELDFKGTLEKTNDYIRTLTSMLQGEELFESGAI
jgi:hypothetical protein